MQQVRFNYFGIYFRNLIDYDNDICTFFSLVCIDLSGVDLNISNVEVIQCLRSICGICMIAFATIVPEPQTLLKHGIEQGLREGETAMRSTQKFWAHKIATAEPEPP